jgi:hypothetical protein
MESQCLPTPLNQALDGMRGQGFDPRGTYRPCIRRRSDLHRGPSQAPCGTPQARRGALAWRRICEGVTDAMRMIAGPLRRFPGPSGGRTCRRNPRRRPESQEPCRFMEIGAFAARPIGTMADLPRHLGPEMGKGLEQCFDEGGGACVEHASPACAGSGALCCRRAADHGFLLLVRRGGEAGPAEERVSAPGMKKRPNGMGRGRNSDPQFRRCLPYVLESVKRLFLV